MKAKSLFSICLTLTLSACSFNFNTSSSEDVSSEPISQSQNPESSSDTTSEVSSKESEPTTEDTSSYISSSSKQEKELPTTTGVCVFAPSNYTHIWAWTKDGSGDHNIFDKNWPGEETIKFDNNWRYYNFNDYKSLWVILSIDGKNQTIDHEIASEGYWWFNNGSWTNENPFTPEEEDTSSSSSESATSESEYSIPTPPPSGELDNTHRTWYQLLVYSFADGNNDGIGDFKGLIQHLDYLEDLGIRGIWLSPCNEAASYHGYDVKNYYSINPAYEVGDYNFERLLNECHDRDINVIMDMVVNHTSSQNPWTWQHPSWYSGEHVFDGSMPDLNYDNSEVRAEIKKVGKYWLDKGVDGFRLDGAAWIYGGGGGWNVEQDKFQKTIAWWNEYSTYLKSVKSDVYLVGEVWTDLQYIEQFYGSGMNAFNFSASYWAKDAINNQNPVKWVEECVGFQSRLRQKNASGVEASFLSNHDTGRFASQMGDKGNLMLANALNVIAPGGGFVYYGDELGMTGSSSGWTDQSYRTQMPFKSGQTNPNNYMGTGASSDTKSGKSADDDAKDASSMYSSLASVINFKNAYPALYSAQVSQISASTNNIGIMKYEAGEEDFYLVLNTTGNSQSVTVTGDFEAIFEFESNGQVTTTETTVTLSNRSFAVLKASDALTFASK